MRNEPEERLNSEKYNDLAMLRLTPLALSVKLSDMQTNVSSLLREFPRIKRAALAGDRVIIRTREGNLVLTAQKPAGDSLFGALRENIRSKDLKPEDSGASPSDWTAEL